MNLDLTFGQYYETDSVVHRLDPRIKILILIAYVVFIFVVKNFYGFLVLGLFLIGTIILSRIPLFDVLRSIKGIAFIILITVVLNLFFYKAETETVLFWIITKEALIFSAFMALRLILLIVGSVLLTFTTTPVALTDGIESLLYPLKFIKFPVHELALVMSIALRFIPILMAETERIMMAQKARGADFESGNVFKRAKSMIPVLIPLLISAFRRAEELGDAMDSRCYSSTTVRTKYKKLTIKGKDVVASLISIVFFAGVIVLNHFGGVV